MCRKRRITSLVFIVIICSLVVLSPFCFYYTEHFDSKKFNDNLDKTLPDGRKTKVYRTSNIDIDFLLKTGPLYHEMKVPTNSSCREKQPMFLRQKFPITALVSYPGSGSSWVRHLVQQMTGRCF